MARKSQTISTKPTYELPVSMIGRTVAPNVQYRGPRKFRIQTRTSTLKADHVADSLQEAVEWIADLKAKTKGIRAKVDILLPDKTLLRQACEVGLMYLKSLKGTAEWKPNFKNHRSKIKWWGSMSGMGDWALSAIDGFALKDLVKELQREDDVGNQTIIHRLQSLKWLLDHWRDKN